MIISAARLRCLSDSTVTPGANNARTVNFRAINSTFFDGKTDSTSFTLHVGNSPVARAKPAPAQALGVIANFPKELIHLMNSKAAIISAGRHSIITRTTREGSIYG